MPVVRNSLIILTGALIAASPAVWAQAVSETNRVDVTISTADAKDAGTVTFEQADHGVLVKADLKNLPAGPHGFHIHEKGACSPNFDAAGGHFNPLKSEHGFEHQGGYHVGDLPNIIVGADGTAKAEFLVPQVSLRAGGKKRYPFNMRDADGSSIMIHASGDDYRTMASSGARVACGVIAPPAR